MLNKLMFKILNNMEIYYEYENIKYDDPLFYRSTRSIATFDDKAKNDIIFKLFFHSQSAFFKLYFRKKKEDNFLIDSIAYDYKLQTSNIIDIDEKIKYIKKLKKEVLR